ncbi:hypothetical protein H8356DRAFT_1361640 [Neocallimastix lanati (nom. inval.)]|nr:hypothetical protein H8356DRAFT_1361640 [Neocallimastix sp. JGI-2020a]
MQRKIFYIKKLTDKLLDALFQNNINEDIRKSKKKARPFSRFFSQEGWLGLQTRYCPNCGSERVVQGINIWVYDFMCLCRYILLGDVDILLNCNLSDVYAIPWEVRNWRSTPRKSCPVWTFLPIWKCSDYLILTTLKEDMSNKISELTNNEVPINFEMILKNE